MVGFLGFSLPYPFCTDPFSVAWDGIASRCNFSWERMICEC
jgi:hypothetical protein